MAKQRFLVSTKKPGLEFRVTKAVPAEDGDGLMCTLLGAHNIEFIRRVNDEVLERYGYVVQVREVESQPV